MLIGLGLFGAALLYGDGMITPAISVLSAIEGLQVATSIFTPYVVPITVVVLIALFFLQRYGTARVGAMFGPVMLVWFAVIAILGLMHIVREPHVLGAVNPEYAVRFFIENGRHGFLVLGAVFLCVTGGEALYADMGHVAARPIRIAWFVIVFPCLVLNYFGQGGYETPRAAHRRRLRLRAERRHGRRTPDQGCIQPAKCVVPPSILIIATGLIGSRSGPIVITPETPW